MAETTAIKYRAFLSYSHRDKAWGKWLHGALEGYRVDKDLVGRGTLAGPVPTTLRPIFRDREDFSAGHSLTEQTIAALEASQFLIVLCSPAAAQSKYVNEEIHRFKVMGRPDRVIPVIIDGEPGDPARECFPPALRFKLGVDGELTDEHEEPIAADARALGDGKEIAKQKVVAGLLGLGLDEIVRRAEQARKRRNRFWAALAGVFLLLALAATGSAVYAWQQLKTNEAFLNATLKRATEIIDTAVAQAEKYNVPRTATLQLLGKAEGLFDDMARLGRPTPELQYRKAWMLIQFARNYAVLGQTDKRREIAIEAHRLMRSLAAEDAGNITYQRDQSAAFAELGDVLVEQGNLAEALSNFRAGLAIMERLANSDPDSVDLQRNRSPLLDRIGSVLMAQGNSAEALQTHRASLAIRERLATADPNNTRLQNDLLVSYNNLGDVFVKQGNQAEALNYYRKGVATIKRLATNPPNADSLHRLWGFYARIGNALYAQGKLSEALTNFHDGLEIMERVAAADPQNAGWQLDLSWSYEKLGYVFLKQGNLAEALQNHRAGLAIRERWVAADPKNTRWQDHLSGSYEQMGNLLIAQGNLAEALQSHRASLAIRERLAAADPTNAHLQVDLAVPYVRIGAMLVAQGKLEEALTSYRTGLTIMQRLAGADPNNADWQYRLSVVLYEVGDVLQAQGDLAGALANYRQSVAILERLAAANPTNMQWHIDLAVNLVKLAALGDPEAEWMAILSRAIATLEPFELAHVLTGPQQSWLNNLRAALANVQARAATTR